MTRLLKKIRQIYGDMNLQSKFTIVLSIAVTIPVLIVGIFFYTRLYDMVVSDTIRKEQDASSEAAPLIEARIQKILDAYEEITELGFYETLFHQPVNSPFQMLLDPRDAEAFQKKAQELIDGQTITGLQIYMDFPTESVKLFHDELTQNYFVPMSLAQGIGMVFFREQENPSSTVRNFIWENGKNVPSEIWRTLFPLLFIIREMPIRLTLPFIPPQIS